jgi:hypothetical protein
VRPRRAHRTVEAMVNRSEFSVVKRQIYWAALLAALVLVLHPRFAEAAVLLGA